MVVVRCVVGVWGFCLGCVVWLDCGSVCFLCVWLVGILLVGRLVGGGWGALCVFFLGCGWCLVGWCSWWFMVLVVGVCGCFSLGG